MHRKIGLAGKSGSGKNVIADMLCAKHGFRQIAVADGIRDEANLFLQLALGIEGAKADLPNSFEVVLEAFRKAIWTKPTPPEVRILLQWWGTEYRRSQDPDYWIKQLASRLNNDDKIVVSDVRLPDEMTSIRESGGEVWLVVRDGIANVGIQGHATEHGLDDATFDRTIFNNGTLDELYSQIDGLMTP